MKTRKKRTKKYRGPTDTYNPIDLACNAARTISQENRDKLLGPALAGYNALREGRASRSDWNAVIDCLNAGEALAQIGIGSNLEDEFIPCFQAMHAIATRMLDGKGSTCRATELEAIRHGLNNYGVQIKLCSQSEYNKAVNRVRNMLTNGKYLTADSPIRAA